jgi:hypothetical protein
MGLWRINHGWKRGRIASLPDEVRVVDAEAVVSDRPGAQSIGAPDAQVVHVAHAARPQVAAIRVRRLHDRTVVGSHNREGIRQSIVVRDIVARHVRHGDVTLLDRPHVILTLSQAAWVPAQL